MNANSDEAVAPPGREPSLDCLSYSFGLKEFKRQGRPKILHLTGTLKILILKARKFIVVANSSK